MDNRLSFNERRFLELIFREKAISRGEMAERLGLTGASSSRITARLLEMGILREEVERSGTPGQPRRPLGIKPNRIFSAGINFALNTVDVALIDLSGQATEVVREGLERSSPTDAARSANEILERIIKRRGITRSDIVGVGISVPGNFPANRGSVLPNALFTEFDNVDLDAIFGKVMDLPTTIENDGACAALGEFYFAEGHRHDVFFMFHLGHGFNAGALLHGRLYRGAFGNACVTGVLFPYGKPRPTGTDLVNELSKRGMPFADVADLADIPAEGEVVVTEWIEHAASQLEEACRIATGFFDPSVIVIGGRLPSGLTERLTERIRWRDLPGPSRGLGVAPVMASKLGPNAGAIGAACVPFFSRFFPGSMESGFNNYVNGRRD